MATEDNTVINITLPTGNGQQLLVEQPHQI